MNDLPHALLHVFRMQPGQHASAAAVVPRIAGPPSEEDVAAVIADLESAGRIEALPGGGWRTVPEPDPVAEAEALRGTLLAIIEETSVAAMRQLARDALDAHPPPGQSRAGR